MKLSNEMHAEIMCHSVCLHFIRQTAGNKVCHNKQTANL